MKRKSESILQEERLSPRGTQLGWRVTSPLYKGGKKTGTASHAVTGASGTFREGTDLDNLVSLEVDRDLLDDLLEEKIRQQKRQLQVWKSEEILSVAKRILYKRQLECFFMHFYRGMGVVEISRALQVHQPQVTQALAISIKKIQKFFKVLYPKRYKYCR